MFRSNRDSLNREVAADLRATHEIIKNTIAEGSFSVGGEKGTFRIVQRSGAYSIYVSFNFNEFPSSMWSEIRRNITSMVVKTASSNGFRVPESAVHFH